MTTVREVLSGKGPMVFSIGPQATVYTAAIHMNQARIGCLVVMEDGIVRGIFTERDILARVVAERRDPAQTPVEEVMTEQVVCCRPDTGLDEARSIMKNRRIRHLPVIDEDGRVHGLISIGDLNAELVNNQEVTIHYLHEYIYGSV